MNINELLAKFAPSAMADAQEQVDQDVAEYEEKNREWLDQRSVEYKAGIESAKTARMFWLTLGTACTGMLCGFIFLNAFGLWQGLAMAGAINSATFLTAKKKLLAIAFTAVSMVSVLGYFGHNQMLNRGEIYQAKLEIKAVEDYSTNTEQGLVAAVIFFGVLAVASGSFGRKQSTF